MLLSKGKLIVLILVSLKHQLVRSWLSQNVPPRRIYLSLSATTPKEEDWLSFDDLEVLQGDGIDFEEDDEDWTPDAERYREKPKHLTPANEVIPQEPDIRDKTSEPENKRPTPYTDEEEELAQNAFKSIGLTAKKRHAAKGSQELDGINSESPVVAFKGYPK